MRRSLRVALSVAFMSAICLVMLAAVDVHASPRAAANRVAGKSTCVVHNVYLNGNKPARVTCGKWSTGGISPYIQEQTCDTSYWLEIVSSTQGYWCFYGSGYIGLGGTTSGDIYNVTRVQGGGGNGWIMYYNPPFTAGTGIKFGFAYTTTYANPPFDGHQKVTQVYIY